MKSYISTLYQKAGTPPGKVKWLDDAAATVSNSYYNKSRGWGQTASELPSLGNNPVTSKKVPTTGMEMS